MVPLVAYAGVLEGEPSNAVWVQLHSKCVVTFCFGFHLWDEKQLSPGSFDILTPTRCGPCSSQNVPDGWSGLQISDDIVSDTKTCNMPWAAEPSRNHGRMLLQICFEGALEIIADLKEIFRSHTKVQAVSHVSNVVDGAGASGSRSHIDIPDSQKDAVTHTVTDLMACSAGNWQLHVFDSGSHSPLTSVAILAQAVKHHFLLHFV